MLDLSKLNKQEYLLDFVVKKGIAKNWRVVLTKQCIDSHRNKHGMQRPEIFNQNFIKNEIRKAIETPAVVYPNVRKKKGKLIYKPKGIIIFYKEQKNDKWISEDNSPINYIQVRVSRKRNMTLEIITAFISTKINHKNLCKPLKNIYE